MGRVVALHLLLLLLFQLLLLVDPRQDPCQVQEDPCQVQEEFEDIC